MTQPTQPPTCWFSENRFTYMSRGCVANHPFIGIETLSVCLAEDIWSSENMWVNHEISRAGRQARALHCCKTLNYGTFCQNIWIPCSEQKWHICVMSRLRILSHSGRSHPETIYKKGYKFLVLEVIFVIITITAIIIIVVAICIYNNRIICRFWRPEKSPCIKFSVFEQCLS